MANNRLWLHCNTCGADRLLSKYYPSTSWTPFHISTTSIDDFICDHGDVSHLPAKTSLMWGGEPFSVWYETPAAEQEDAAEAEITT